MILTAGQLSTFQRCPRLWLHNGSGDIRRWRPKSLFSSLFRSAVLQLSNGADLSRTTAEAVSQYLETAAKPGLDTKQPFESGRSFASILKTSLARIHACHIPSLEQGPSIILSGEHKWRVGAFVEKSGGRLHQWSIVDSLNDKILARELHSWQVFGDCAATGLPMTLHVLEVGREGADGRQHTPWCRAFRHPAIMGRFAFQQKDGSPLGEGWKPVYYQDSLRNNPETWIALMERDRVDALKDVSVQQVSPEHARQFKPQVLSEIARMEEAKTRGWRDFALYRPACDLPPCGWQFICFR